MTVTTPMSTDLAGDAIADIRAAMGVLYVLAADGAVDAKCMHAAVNRVEANLAVLEAMTASPPTAILPVKTLADIAAEAAVMPAGTKLRASTHLSVEANNDGRRSSPPAALTAIDGGRA